jgi:lysophospholipase L1-like esterase
MKAFFALLLLLPTLLLAQTPTSTKALRIFTLGDSNGTFPQSWPQQLKQDLPGAEVFNISKSGRTIGFVNNGDSTLNSLLVIDENIRKAAEFAQNQPFDYVVLELGTNDAKAVFADRQADVSQNLEKLIQRLKTCPYPAVSRAQIIIISPPPYGLKAEAQAKYTGGNERVRHMSNTFKQVAKRTGCRFVNGYKTPGLNINTMTADGLHLDAAGSKQLIMPVLAIISK